MHSQPSSYSWRPRWLPLLFLGAIFVVNEAGAQALPGSATFSAAPTISGPTSLPVNTTGYFTVTSTVQINNPSSYARTFRVVTNFFVNGVATTSTGTAISVPGNSTVTRNVQNVSGVSIASTGTKSLQSSTNVKNDDELFICDSGNSDTTVQVFLQEISNQNQQ